MSNNWPLPPILASADLRAILWPSVWLWGAVTVVAAMDVVWIVSMPLSLQWSDIPPISLYVVGCLSISFALRRHHRDPRTIATASGAAFVLLSWIVLRVFNHLVMTTAFPMADNTLAGWDAALGFDWLKYVTWLDHHPQLLIAMSETYNNLTPFSVVVFACALLFDGPGAAREFLILFFCSAIIASAIGIFFPSDGAMVHYNPTPNTFRYLTPKIGTWFVAPLAAVRDDPHLVIRIRALPGLTAFPSFHTAMGLITIYCARHRVWLLWPATLFNLFMIGSVPVFGSHYIVDIIAGAILTALLIAVLRLHDKKAGLQYLRPELEQHPAQPT